MSIWKPLAVDAPAHLARLLHVRQLATPQRDPRREARGPAKGVVAHVDNGEPVDLPDHSPVHLNAYRSFVV